MRHGISRVALVAGLAATGGPVAAQEGAPLTLDTITLTASGTPVDLSRTGASVTVLDADDIRAAGVLGFGNLVAGVPGVGFAANGGLGTLGGLRIRGLSPYYIGTRIDGIDVTDPSQTQTAYDFGTTTTGGLGRVEVLRGSQSALYGSEAIGGVVDITTWRPVRDGTSGEIGIEAGSNATYTGTGSAGLRTGRAELAFSVSRTITDGISAYADGDEDDAFRATFGSLYAAYDLTGTLRVGVNGFWRDSYSEYDSATADTDSWTGGKLRGGRLFAEMVTGAVTHEFSVAHTTSKRDLYQFGGHTYYTGERDQFAYKGRWDGGQAVSLNWGLDRTEEDFAMRSAFGDARGDAATNSVWGEVLWAATPDLDLSLALRRDEHSGFGGKTSGRAALAWRPNADWVLRGVAATGFRAPSLYELHSAYGNPDFVPETSRSYEVGAERLLPGGGSIQATLFDTRIKDRIVFDGGSYDCESGRTDNPDDPFDPYPGCYAQIGGDTRTRGIEIAGRAPVADGWEVFGSYTYTDADADSESGADGRGRLALAPRHMLSLGVDGRLAARWSGRLALRHAADFTSVEAGSYPAAYIEMPDYTVVDASVTYEITDSAQAYLRVENLFDKAYQVIDGYGQPGRQVFVGVRASF